MVAPSRLVGLVLFLGTLAVFWPLGEADFVNYDDPGYVYENPQVAAGVTPGGVAWAFSSFHKANWHPASWLSHMIDVELFGMNPGRHHLVNVTLHALNAVLLFAFLLRATGALWPSALAAALFTVHPLHVESVAWISERKDVLSTVFWLSTMHVYLSWSRFGGGMRYGMVGLLFSAGLLAKPMVVTLPAALLLLDVWPLGRTAWVAGAVEAAAGRTSLARLVTEKVPLFALAAAASVLTLLAQSAGGAVVGTPVLSLSARLASSVVAYVWYLEKTVWPSGLAVFYPHPYLGATNGPPLSAWLGPLVLLVLLTAIAVGQFARRPYLLVGWLWFLGTLVPVIGLVQVGAQATADRYSYVPLIGPFFAISWLAAGAAGETRWRRRAVVTAAGVWLLACIAVTRAQLPHWANARALAARSVAATEENFVMHYNLALALQAEGDLDGARRHYEKAIEIHPSQSAMHGNLGVVLVALGRPQEAVRHYRVAIELAPDDPGAANNLAWLLATSPDEAIRNGPEARRLAEAAVRTSEGKDAQILDTLAAAQAEVGDFEAAVDTGARAARRAREDGRFALAAEIERRLAEYSKGRPHRDPGASPRTPSR